MGVETLPAAAEVATEEDERFKLVGYGRFVRTNPRSDRFPVLSFHHIEFWTSDAATASGRFSFGLGMRLAAVSGLTTGNPVHASHLIRSGELQFLFSAPYGPVPAGDLAGGVRRPAIPSFDPEAARRFSAAHGLAVRAIAIRVANAFEAFDISVARGARPAFPPANLGGGFALSEVELYGDVVLRYISGPEKPPKAAPSPSEVLPQNPSETPSLGLETGDSGSKIPSFLPGFEDLDDTEVGSAGFGLRRLDHAVGNVADLGEAVKYITAFTGFHQFAEFTAEDVGTAESGLNSVVLANNDENVLIPVNEPVHGTKRRSQIQTYLDYNGGAGLQHLALKSDDVLKTLREMRKRSKLGGFEFMASPPPNYYDGVRRRAGDVLTEEQIRECQELGVLVDRDDQGVLLQIFTKPVGDRPTMFLEIIQRIGCMMKDKEGREYQKGGCGGFGKGNFSELFKSIEEYEKSLVGKQQAAVPAA